MGPYTSFDMQNNALIIMLDKYGSCLINLRTSQVYQLQMYENQVNYRKPIFPQLVPNVQPKINDSNSSNFHSHQKYTNSSQSTNQTSASNAGASTNSQHQ